MFLLLSKGNDMEDENHKDDAEIKDEYLIQR